MGDVTVTVPRDNLLILDANRRIFENPALLKMVSPFGIDVLKIRFNSIADNEDNLLDGTFKYVNDLKGLQMLDVDESETTDANLSKLKQLPHLRTISCLNTEINGDCFKDLAALPALTELILTNCPIKESNLKYLQKFPRLSILDLGVHGHHVMAHHLHYLTQTGVQDIAKCHGIVNLNVSEQTRFDDSCLKYLAEMKNLRYLYLTNTSITLNGLSALRGLKLKQIALPSTLHKNAAEVARIFPHTVCKIADSPPSQAARSVSNDSRANDINVIFSPLR
jgi:Leucine-rich repeat (LRR) protein